LGSENRREQGRGHVSTPVRGGRERRRPARGESHDSLAAAYEVSREKIPKVLKEGKD
jgi:hypothetical protein